MNEIVSDISPHSITDKLKSPDVCSNDRTIVENGFNASLHLMYHYSGR